VPIPDSPTPAQLLLIKQSKTYSLDVCCSRRTVAAVLCQQLQPLTFYDKIGCSSASTFVDLTWCSRACAFFRKRLPALVSKQIVDPIPRCMSLFLDRMLTFCSQDKGRPWSFRQARAVRERAVMGSPRFYPQPCP
jgi:hypothetical protein